MGISPIEWVLVEYLHQPTDRAKLVSAAYQVMALVMLLVVAGMFAEWRFVKFEELGCKAYCNCTARMEGATYAINDNGAIDFGEFAPDEAVIDRMVVQYEECEDGWDACSIALTTCKRDLKNKV